MYGRYSQFRANAPHRIVVILLLCAVAFLLLAPVTSAAGGIYVGPNPEKGGEERLIYVLEPGETAQAEVVVVNNGDEAVELVVYAADAFNSPHGCVSFCELGEEAGNRVGGWLTLSATEVRLGAKERKIIPFTLRVPPDARPGQYQAGILAQEKAPSVTEAEISGSESEKPTVLVTFISRVAARVRVFIPGPREAGLAIPSINQVWHGTSVGLDVELHNTGNVPIKVEGTLEVTDDAGKLLGSLPISIPCLLSWGKVTYIIDTKTLLPPGQYSVRALLSYESVARPVPGAPEGAYPVAFATGSAEKSFTFEMEEKEVEEAVESMEKAGLDVEPWTREAPPTAPFNLLLIISIGAGVIIIGMAILLVVLLRRRRQY